MSRQIEADYNQTFLLPPSLEDWVGPDHPARFIRVFVEEMDLVELEVQWGEGVEGRPPYSADLLLKVWLYGYYRGIRSTRKLEMACRDEMGMLWLTGMHAPDHNTLWRFFKQNKKALRGMFRQSVRVAVKSDLVGLVLHALDGTKIQSEVANRSGWHQEKLEKSLARLDKVVDQWEETVEGESSVAEPGVGLPETLQEAESLRKKVREKLSELEESGEKHLNPHDRDARVMQCRDRGKNTFGYNGQVVVDEASGLLVAQELVNDCNDMQQLSPMLGCVEAELGETAGHTVAEAGYASGEGLAEAEALTKEHKVLVTLPPQWDENPENPYHASHFTYDAQADVVVCPRGEKLRFKHERTHKRKRYPLRLYRCENKTCPVRNECTKEKKGRGIEIGPYHEALQRQRKRNRTPEEKEKLQKRGWLIESVFGWIKQTQGFRRFTVRGLPGVKTQWALMCASYNLHKLYRNWKAGNLPGIPAPG